LVKVHRLKKICTASFRETSQCLKFPLNGLRTHSRISPVAGLLPLATGRRDHGRLWRYFWIRESGTGQ